MKITVGDVANALNVYDGRKGAIRTVKPRAEITELGKIIAPVETVASRLNSELSVEQLKMLFNALKLNFQNTDDVRASREICITLLGKTIPLDLENIDIKDTAERLEYLTKIFNILDNNNVLTESCVYQILAYVTIQRNKVIQGKEYQAEFYLYRKLEKTDLNTNPIDKILNEIRGQIITSFEQGMNALIVMLEKIPTTTPRPALYLSNKESKGSGFAKIKEKFDNGKFKTIQNMFELLRDEVYEVTVIQTLYNSLQIIKQPYQILLDNKVITYDLFEKILELLILSINCEDKDKSKKIWDDVNDGLSVAVATGKMDQQTVTQIIDEGLGEFPIIPIPEI